METSSVCPKCGNDVNAFMLYCSKCNTPLDLYYKQSQEEYTSSVKDGLFAGVRIASADDEVCQTCSAYQDRIFTPAEMPRIPIDGCTSEGGCRCCYSPVMPF